ncbi:unnamed protein product [Rotaria sp. Silwood2]|nr:unnamed protein product [Rotaria sp. Silwood2]
MEDDFDNYDYANGFAIESMNNDDNSVMNIDVDNDCSLDSNGKVEVKSNSIGISVFLCSKSHHKKLRLALSNRVLAVLFHLDNKRVISHIISQVRKALMKDFIPYHLQTAIEEHQTAIATILHTNKPNQLCVVADGTYLFIQKI